MPINIIGERQRIVVLAVRLRPDRCNCWNKLKEEIKAAVYEKNLKSIEPVNSVIKVNSYYDRGRRDSGSGDSFTEILKRERAKAHPQTEKREEALRHMEGMNQYNRHATEVFFLLSRNMDYKA